jgi:hypothetical protein
MKSGAATILPLELFGQRYRGPTGVEWAARAARAEEGSWKRTKA